MTAVISESDALHARVRAFASGQTPETFDEVATSIARFQARHSPPFARLVALYGKSLASADAIPAVPAEAFRLTRVAVHPPELDCARFVTSGTTASERGTHALRTTRTYEELSLAFGRAALTRSPARHTVVALAPPPTDPHSSSLLFMFATFMQALDGRALGPGSFDVRAPGRWLLDASGVRVDALHRAVGIARERGEPLLVLSTSLALLALVSELGEHVLALPEGSVVMQTGGYKGRTIATDPAELRARAARSLALPEAAIVAEYGMTELCSQLYEGTLPGGALRGPPGLYLPPSWLRVTPVDPATLEPVAPGEIGIARFVDLANVDSAIAIVTRDRIRATDGAIELLGREPGAPARGCSLAVEALLAGNSDGSA